jgi:hypothetical protein
MRKMSRSVIISLVLTFAVGAGLGILLAEEVIFSQAYSSLKSSVLQNLWRRGLENTTASSESVNRDSEATDQDTQPSDDYSKPVDQDLVDFFGEPFELNKTKFDYAAPPNDDFLKDRIPVTEYFFGPSIIGAAQYFTSEAQDRKRDELLATAKEKGVEEVITDVFGIGLVDIGDIESVDTKPVRQSAEMEIAYYQMGFTTGAIAQFYVATPPPETSNRRIMLAPRQSPGSLRSRLHEFVWL